MEFEDLLKLMVEKGGSDMFITAGVPPQLNLMAKLYPLLKHLLALMLHAKWS
jgi:twitching motility protein PilU